MASINSITPIATPNKGNGTTNPGDPGMSLKGVAEQVAALTALVSGMLQAQQAIAAAPTPTAPTAPAPSTRKAKRAAPTAPDYAGEMTVHGFRNDYAGMLAFANQVIPVLAKVTGKSVGVHCKYSGFNSAFRAEFPGSDPVEWCKQATARGHIQSRMCKRGFMLYVAGTMPAFQATDGAKILDKIFG